MKLESWSRDRHKKVKFFGHTEKFAEFTDSVCFEL